MEKDFKKWHIKKSVINDSPRKPFFFHEKEIWFCHLGVNIGFEQDGKGRDFLRPIIIIRKFNNKIFWAIPLTKTDKIDSRYYYKFLFKSADSAAILSQIRLVDARRLSYRIGVLSDSDFRNIIEKLKALFP